MENRPDNAPSIIVYLLLSHYSSSASTHCNSNSSISLMGHTSTHTQPVSRHHFMIALFPPRSSSSIVIDCTCTSQRIITVRERFHRLIGTRGQSSAAELQPSGIDATIPRDCNCWLDSRSRLLQCEPQTVPRSAADPRKETHIRVVRVTLSRDLVPRSSSQFHSRILDARIRGTARSGII
jgi:hypothetical protein